jgi:magnesium-transporting ATPase (P-type)
VAIEAADMVLIRSNLHDLVVALDLARLVFTRIQQNFVWAMIYNLLAVPYAAGIWFPWTHLVLPPQYAGLAMAASSVSVVVSSMMLWLYKRPAVLSDDANAPKSSGSMFQRAKRLVSMIRSSVERVGNSRASDTASPLSDATFDSNCTCCLGLTNTGCF